MDRSKPKMAKYNFSIQLGNKKFGVDGCDSFDEAIAKVEKGVYEYKLAHPEEFKGVGDWSPAERLQRYRDEMNKTTSAPAEITPVNLPESTGSDKSPVV
jgi:hypothetical protein